VLLWGLLGLLTAGCSRAFHRHRADEEVYALVDCASTDPRWPLDNFTIEPDPRSRMFDPNDPDCPPMPPDDPTSHRLMECVDGKRGWPFWGEYGYTTQVENPTWRDYLPYNEDGVVVLNRKGAVQMALLHSPDYQKELEDLYRAALDVTLQRFQFDTQFFGGNSNTFDTDGPLSGSASSSSSHTTKTPLGFSRSLATGSQLAMEVANEVVWQFSGPDGYNVTTPLTFTFTQPLLRFAGRAVVLEALTSAERSLLATIRQLERFRREFYVRTVVGPGGLLGLLEDQLRIRNQRANVASLRDSLDQLEALFRAGRIDLFQVDQNRQGLYRAQIQLLSIVRSYQDALDSFKILMGLPPHLDVAIEDALLARFELIDASLTATQDAVSNVLSELRDPDAVVEPSVLASQLAAVISQTAAHLDSVADDLQSLTAALPARRQDLRELSTREEFQRGDIHPGLCDTAALDERAAALHEDYAKLSARLHATIDQLEQHRKKVLDRAAEQPPDAAQPEPRQEALIGLATELSDQLVQLSLIQAGARLDTITLVPIDLGAGEAFEIARANRRDWMNARATLVDQWRQIQVAANDLRSDFDVTFSGDLTPRSEGSQDPTTTTTHNTTGNLRVGLQFDAPLARLAERNTYRRRLIDYQEARRTYYTFEDEISRSLRSTLRRIRLNRLEFELQRAAVRTAITQVDQKRLELRRPPQPGESPTKGATTARDLVDALVNLLDAQNAFLNVWVEYETLRVNLDLDLGTMELDAEGMWIDPGPIRPTEANEPDAPEELPLPDPWPADEPGSLDSAELYPSLTTLLGSPPEQTE